MKMKQKLPNKINSMLFLIALLFGINVDAQNIPNITDISYVTTQTQNFLIPKDVDVSTLSQYDLLALKQSKIVQRNHFYIDDNNNLQLEITILNDNEFPTAGINLPEKTTINNDGVFKEKEGVNTKDFDHSEKSTALFGGLSSMSANSGLITSLIFQVPNVEKGSDKGNENGDNYTSSDGIISLTSNLGKMMWDTNTNTSYEVNYSDGTDVIGYKKKTEYKKTLCDILMKSKETEYQKYTLPSGLCIKRILEVVYSEYSYDCLGDTME